MTKTGRSILRGAKEALAFVRKKMLCRICKEESPVVERWPGTFVVDWACACIKPIERKP